MKRARLILAGIAMFAVIGGTIAATASKRNSTIYCRSTTGLPTTTVRNYTISEDGYAALCTTTATLPVVPTLISFKQ